MWSVEYWNKSLPAPAMVLPELPLIVAIENEAIAIVASTLLTEELEEAAVDFPSLKKEKKAD